MANWKGAAGGAASGAGTGAAIGSAFVPGIGTAIGAGIGAIGGGLLGLFGNDDEYLQKRIALWQDALKAYQDDPANAKALQVLEELSKGGITDQERADLLQASTEAGGFARGREGAVDLQQAQRGGGVSRSGLTPGLEDLSAQGATQRYAMQTSQAAGQASTRRMAAIAAGNQERARQQAMLAYYRNMLSGAYDAGQGYDERSTEAMMQNIAGGADQFFAGQQYSNLLKKQAGPSSSTMAPPSSSIPNPSLGSFGSGRATGDFGGFGSYFYGGG